MLNSENNPKLSFCIPTFNRVEKVCNLVCEILKYEGFDIEVIVSDNCSTDNTKLELLKISDKRFHFKENVTNIGAIENYLKVIEDGQGQYIYFCTDKDLIKASGINDFLQFLKTNPDIVAGYSTFDINQKKENIIFAPGVESLIHMAYLSRHPTGYFYRRDVLSNLHIIHNYSKIEKVGPFPFEFILADFCMLGKTAIVNIPLCYMESIEDVKSIKSYSYSEANNNLYFTPDQRYAMFEKYINHIKSLPLSDKEKKIVVKNVFRYGLHGATIGYRNMIQNKTVCEHYFTSSRNIGLIESIKNGFKFSIKFVRYNNFSTPVNRLLIFLDFPFNYILGKMFVVISKLSITNLLRTKNLNESTRSHYNF